MLKIGIDARPLTLGGAGQYTSALIRGILKIDTDNSYVIFTSDDVIKKKLLEGLNHPNVKTVNIKTDSLTLKQHIIFLISNPAKGLDLYHYPHFDMPITRFNKSVITIHDLYPLVLPGYCSKSKKFYFRELTRLNLARSSKVIAISNHTKQDILDRFDIDPRKIAVIYSGVDTLYGPIDEDQIKKEILTRYGIKDRFILYVGNAKPHKNLIRLIKAFGNLSPAILNEYQLVLAGSATKEYLKLHQEIKKSGIAERIVFIGYVPKDDMPHMYNLADILVLVSLYEGFGLPMAEAMACGTPVLASNIAAMPEIVGEAGILVDPHETDSITNGMEMILNNSALKEHMKQKGLERAKAFSSMETAKQVLQVYKEAVNG